MDKTITTAVTSWAVDRQVHSSIFGEETGWELRGRPRKQQQSLSPVTADSKSVGNIMFEQSVDRKTKRRLALLLVFYCWDSSCLFSSSLFCLLLLFLLRGASCVALECGAVFWTSELPDFCVWSCGRSDLFTANLNLPHVVTSPKRRSFVYDDDVFATKLSI